MDAAIATVDKVAVAGLLIPVGSYLVGVGGGLVGVGGGLVAAGAGLITFIKRLVVVGQRSVGPGIGRWIGHFGFPSGWTTAFRGPCPSGLVSST